MVETDSTRKRRAAAELADTWIASFAEVRRAASQATGAGVASSYRVSDLGRAAALQVEGDDEAEPAPAMGRRPTKPRRDAGSDDEWEEPGTKPATALGPPPRDLVETDLSAFYLRRPHRLDGHKWTLIAPEYPRKRNWGAAQGVRELTQNWRDGALEVARRIWARRNQPGGFEDLRFVRSDKGKKAKVVIYVNGAPGPAWVAPVYAVAEYTWCVRNPNSGAAERLVARRFSRA